MCHAAICAEFRTRGNDDGGGILDAGSARKVHIESKTPSSASRDGLKCVFNRIRRILLYIAVRHLGRKGKGLTGRDGAGRKPVGAFGVTLQTYTLYYYYHSTDGFQYTLTLRFQLVSRSISYIYSLALIPSPAMPKSCLKIPTPPMSPDPTHDHHHHHQRKCVAFSAEDLERIYIADEWDRTPTEVAQKLSYGSVYSLSIVSPSFLTVPTASSSN